MIPFPLALIPTDGTVSERDATSGDKDPAQCLIFPEVCCRVYGQAHEYIPHPVYNHQVVDEVLFRSGGGCFPFEEGQGIVRPKNGVDTEPYEYRGDRAGRDAERRLGDGHGA